MRLQLQRWVSTVCTLALVLSVAVLPASATVLKLSSHINQHGNVIENFISQNGQYAVYRAEESDGGANIYSARITGGEPMRLSTLDTGFAVPFFGFQISPDSQWVVYIRPARESPTSTVAYSELYRAPIDGSGPGVNLSGVFTTGRNVTSFAISPNGARVVFRADRDAEDVFELYSVPLDGSASPIKLNPPLAVDGDVSTAFRITSESSRVVYIADQDLNDVDELYSVPTTGGSAIKLNPTLVNGGDVGFTPSGSLFVLSPDGARVVYYADQDTDGQLELYSAQVSVAASGIRLHNPIQAGGSLGHGSARISGDGTRVIFIAQLESAAIYPSLYSVSIDGPAGAGLTLNPMGQPVYGASIAGDRALYYDSPGSFRLYSVPLLGPNTASVRLTPATGGVQAFYYNPTGQRVVYYNGNLLSVPLTGPETAAVQLNSVPLEGTLGVRLSPDNTRVVYQSSASLTGARELFSAPITGPYTDSVKINGPLVSGGNVEYLNGFQFAPDGQRVVYRADAETDGKIELYVTDEGNVLSDRVYLPLVLR